jgi:hypothetical protein
MSFQRSGSKRLRSSAVAEEGGQGKSAIDLTQTAEKGIESIPLGKISQASAMRVVDTIEKYEDAFKNLEASLADTFRCTEHQLDAAAHSAVRYMIFSNSNKEGGMVSKSDLMKQIGEHLVSQRRGVSELILAKVQFLLASSFGMDMVELVKPSTKKNVLGTQQSGSGESGTKYFTLKSMVPKEVYKETVGKTDASSVDARWGLLGVIISLITMSGGSLVEEELWRHLNSMGADRTTKHPMLGGVPSDIIDDFVRKRYLKVEKQAGLDEETRSYLVAENALSEITDDDVMSHVQRELAREASAPAVA